MNNLTSRKKITQFLNELLEKDRLIGVGNYWAKEVTLDYGKSNVRRVDYMQFKPVNQLSIDGIEKGIFICYEIKSCVEDFLSGYGQNFIGEKNYLVMTMDTYIKLNEKGEIIKLPYNVGILVSIPLSRKYKDNRLVEEYKQPTIIDIDNSSVKDWYLEVIKQSHQTYRQKSITELLFCMLRSKHKH